jgi:hypothetical protein
MPFSTQFLADFITFRDADGLLPDVLLAGVLLYLTWRRAQRAGLVEEDTAPGVSAATRRRIPVAQTLHALGLVSTAPASSCSRSSTTRWRPGSSSSRG